MLTLVRNFNQISLIKVCNQRKTHLFWLSSKSNFEDFSNFWGFHLNEIAAVSVFPGCHVCSYPWLPLLVPGITSPFLSCTNWAQALAFHWGLWWPPELVSSPSTLPHHCLMVTQHFHSCKCSVIVNSPLRNSLLSRSLKEGGLSPPWLHAWNLDQCVNKIDTWVSTIVNEWNLRGAVYPYIPIYSTLSDIGPSVWELWKGSGLTLALMFSLETEFPCTWMLLSPWEANAISIDTHLYICTETKLHAVDQQVLSANLMRKPHTCGKQWSQHG